MPSKLARKYITRSMIDVAWTVDGAHVPGEVADNDITTAVEVGAGNLCRITVAAGAAVIVAFGDSGVATPSGAVSEVSLRFPNLATEKVYYVLATGDYIRGTVALTHLEVIRV